MTLLTDEAVRAGEPAFRAKALRATGKMRPYVAAGIILILTLLAVALVSAYTPYLRFLELKNYDFMLAVLRGPVEPRPDAVIIAIDETSLQELATAGLKFPWPRSVHAKLIRLLNEAGARVIAFDIIFDFPSEDPADDEAMSQAIRASRAPVVLAATEQAVQDQQFQLFQKLEPIEPFVAAGAKVGYSREILDEDGFLRTGRLQLEGEPTLAVRALVESGEEFDLAGIPLQYRDGEDPFLLVNFVGRSRSIRTVSYHQALEYDKALPKGIFANKVVFIGRSLTVQEIGRGAGASDHFPTPFDPLMPAVETHANVFHTLRGGDYIRQASAPWMWLSLAAVGILITAVVLVVHSFRLKIVLSLVLILGGLGAAYARFVLSRDWHPPVHTLVATLAIFGLNVIYQYRAAERERVHIRKALSGYVSPQVMHEILKNPGMLEIGGTQVQATVLFSDIAGFSKIAERITRPELASLLNAYFDRMGSAIMERGGMINKYIGDAIMAVWGAPLEDPEHAAHACEAGLAMKQIIDAMGGPIRARIGINSGKMIAGNLGHRDRMEYTVIGDAVNLASRLEGANKTFGTVILISESTEELVRGRFLVRPVDRIRVAGKESPVLVYELVAAADGGVPDALRTLVRSFAECIAAYEARDWKRAAEWLERHLGFHPGDPVALAYLDRCRRFAASPPPADWDGVYTLESK